jgi:three-Cys-motif partner protein
MMEHSIAKVELYTKYLARYLNILARNRYVDKIYLYDLMCGEGKYQDDSMGSPIAALGTIKDHYFSNDKTCPDINIWFNDIGESQIEIGKKKIDRVMDLSSSIFCPPNVHKKYTSQDFKDILLEVIPSINSLKNNEKALLFIDPYGYKDVSPQSIKSLLTNKNSELLLFLPVSFIYRFAEKTTEASNFPGGEPIQKFMTELFGENRKGFKSKYDFVFQLLSAFRGYLKKERVFVDTFTIERDKQNVYGLFFFTHHIKGFETMLETKWELDDQSGRGFKLNAHPDLFLETESTDYAGKLQDFISKTDRTNFEVYQFGLHNGFLPKHTKMIFSEWQKSNSYFRVYSSDGSLYRKGAFHLNSKDVKVIFRFEK